MAAWILTKITAPLWLKTHTPGALLKTERDLWAENLWLLEKIVEKIKATSL
jgi:hypothetical protein